MTDAPHISSQSADEAASLAAISVPVVSGVDGRTRGSKRQRRLYRQLAAELSAVRPLTTQDTCKLSNIVALQLQCDKMQSDIVANRPVDVEQLTRLTNTISRLLGSLGIKAPPRRQPSGELARILRGAT
jgi:hypothetical protein